MTKKYSNYKLGEFIGKSEATIRNIKKNESDLYEQLVKQYEINLMEKEKMSKKKMIACINGKGGVGKSSILNILAPKVLNSVILNIDFTQSADEINSSDTVDFAKLAEDHTIKEVIETAFDEYDYIFIDTPGDVSGELMDIIEQIDYFIMPFTPGKRTMDTTIETYNTLFAEGFIEGKHKICMILNNFVSDDEKDTELKKMESEIKKVVLPNNLEMKIHYTSLKHTQVMKTIENQQTSIDNLSVKNKIAYKTAQKRFDTLTRDIINFLELEAEVCNDR